MDGAASRSRRTQAFGPEEVVRRPSWTTAVIGGTRVDRGTGDRARLWVGAGPAGALQRHAAGAAGSRAASGLLILLMYFPGAGSCRSCTRVARTLVLDWGRSTTRVRRVWKRPVPRDREGPCRDARPARRRRFPDASVAVVVGSGQSGVSFGGIQRGERRSTLESPAAGEAGRTHRHQRCGEKSTAHERRSAGFVRSTGEVRRARR